MNLEKFAPELKPCENWSQLAIDTFSKLLNGSEDVIKVVYDIKEKRNNYFFGDLSVEAIPKPASISTVDLGRALISINEAVRVDFNKGLHLLFDQSILDE